MDGDPAHDLDGWVDAVCDRRFWQQLAPELPIEGPPAAPLVAVDDARRDALWNALLTDGWFQLDPVLPAGEVERLARAMLRLRDDAIPVVFAFVYDDPWQLSAQLGEVLAAILGPGFRVLPDFWAWCLDPAQRDKGWHPHRDMGFSSLLPNRQPISLSLWVPLTDATPDNGCIYVLPACRDRHYLARENRNDVVDVQEIRALPAAAGSVLGWTQALLHWGSRAGERARAPRVSFSIEYQRGDGAPFNRPLLAPWPAPSFERRLGLIGKQILQYRHMYALGPGLDEVARRLVARFPPAEAA
jgi:hypothetical protein